MKNKITISDISRETGFSASTISRALNHRDLVNQETYDTIVTAMEHLGYQKFLSAPTQDAPPKTVLVANIPDITNSFYAKIYKGLLSSASTHGWYVIITQERITKYSVDRIKNLLTNCNAAGLIVFDRINEEILDNLYDMLPTVQCLEFNARSKAPYIGIDDFQATITLMEYLVSQNYKKIALINGSMNLLSEIDRQRGYEHTLRKYGMEPDPRLIFQLPKSDYFMASTAVQRLFQARDIIPDAIFAVSDILALAAINVAKQNGYSVPEDIAVIGFDNNSISEMSNPKISTINLPCFEIGFLSSEMIFQICSNGNVKPSNQILNTELILRESTK